MLYLLDKDYNLNKFVLTFLIENNTVSLDKMVTFNGTKAVIVDNAGKLFAVDTSIPTLEELKQEAFNYYEMRSTGWRFMRKGLGDYPAYEKTTEIVNKCEAVEKERKKERCYKKEGELLQLHIMKYVQENFEDNYDNRELIKSLGGDPKRLKQLYIADRLFKAYKKMGESQVMNLDYKWEDERLHITNTIGHFGSAPAHQLTYYLNSGNSYFSLGRFAYMPSMLSVRYTYYPIGLIHWEK